MKSKISIIIVNLNTGRLLKDCVESVFTYENNNFDIEIIIVDQNSSDNSQEIILQLSQKYNYIKYIFNDELKGFAYANNQGFEITSGDYILIMNPDIVFVEPLLLKFIKIFYDEPGIGALCPLLLNKDGVFQQEYFRKYPSLRQFLFFYMFFSRPFYGSSKLRGKYFENLNININSGKLEFVVQIPCAFFFTTRKIFESVGKMDDKYLLFYEDVDLSFHIHKKYKLAIDTSGRVTHLGGESFKNEDNWWLHGRFLMSMNYFFEKNSGALKSFLLKILSVSNSMFIVGLEYCKIALGKKDIYRLNKHKYYLKEFKKVYL